MLKDWFGKKRKESNLEYLLERSRNGDTSARNTLLKQYQPFMLKSASKVCKRYISSSDDEFSVALLAFNQSIDTYSIDKGASFLGFCDLVIQRRIIDYLRKESSSEQTTRFDESGDDEESEMSYAEISVSIRNHQQDLETQNRREEIERYALRLSEFGISFSELPEEMPKHEDAKRNAISIAKTLASVPELIESLLKKKRIPVKELLELIPFSIKTIERNRKYIIAVSLVLIEDYSYIRAFLNEGGK